MSWIFSMDSVFLSYLFSHYLIPVIIDVKKSHDCAINAGCKFRWSSNVNKYTIKTYKLGFKGVILTIDRKKKVSTVSIQFLAKRVWANDFELISKWFALMLWEMIWKVFGCIIAPFPHKWMSNSLTSQPLFELKPNTPICTWWRARASPKMFASFTILGYYTQIGVNLEMIWKILNNVNIHSNSTRDVLHCFTSIRSEKDQ